MELALARPISVFAPSCWPWTITHDLYTVTKLMNILPVSWRTYTFPRTAIGIDYATSVHLCTATCHALYFELSTEAREETITASGPFCDLTRVGDPPILSSNSDTLIGLCTV